MVAIAVDNAGFKLNLEGWTPAHYWGPGLVDQLIGPKPVMISFDASNDIPKIRCVDFESRDGSRIESKETCETLNSPTGISGITDGGNPWDQLVDQQELMTNALTRWEDWDCMNAAELREKGLVLDGAGVLHLLLQPSTRRASGEGTGSLASRPFPTLSTNAFGCTQV